MRTYSPGGILTAFAAAPKSCGMSQDFGQMTKELTGAQQGMQSMQKFVDAGFRLKEIIIKEQHNCRSSDYWNNIQKTFLMLAHEYIFVLEK